MKNPFSFGRLAEGNSFTDREKETERLCSNFSNSTNTILISPRRWGKSSLVKKAGDLSKSATVKVVYLDVFAIRSEQDFYKEFAQTIIKSASSKWEDWVALVKQFFKQIVPKITMGSDPTNTFSISFDWQDIEKDAREILDLPERIAQDKNIRFVICIDEFQNISTFQQPLAFQKQLRSIWQQHQSTCYCLYGSKFHMMQEIFERQSMPFYRFGDLIHLNKISEMDWIQYIDNQFQETGKQINETFIRMIIRSVNRHSYYVQQLSYLVWGRTTDMVTSEIVEEALDDMLNQNAILYQRDTDDLSATQLNFLRAVTSGETTNLSSSNTIKKYNLGTSANVTKIKKQLLNREIIDIQKKEVSFVDPVYELWFQRNCI